jgi:excisionase family DNA binding protein
MVRKPEMEPKVYTVPEVAALLGINLPRAYELTRQPGFPAIRISRRRIIIPKEAFHRWLEQVALDKQSYDTAENQ